MAARGSRCSFRGWTGCFSSQLASLHVFVRMNSEEFCGVSGLYVGLAGIGFLMVRKYENFVVDKCLASQAVLFQLLSQMSGIITTTSMDDSGLNQKSW